MVIVPAHAVNHFSHYWVKVSKVCIFKIHGILLWSCGRPCSLPNITVNALVSLVSVFAFFSVFGNLMFFFHSLPVIGGSCLVEAVKWLKYISFNNADTVWKTQQLAQMKWKWDRSLRYRYQFTSSVYTSTNSSYAYQIIQVSAQTGSTSYTVQ